MIASSITSTDEQLPKQLGRSVVLAGGCTRLPGFAARLAAALQGTDSWRRLDSEGGLKCWGNVDSKAVAVGKIPQDQAGITGREHSCWTGASIIVSTGYGDQDSFWVTKAAYEEKGMNAFREKCP